MYVPLMMISMKAAASLLFIAATAVSGFQVTNPVLARSTNGPPTSPLFASSETSESNAVSTAQEILDDFHSSNLPFRIVVIGNGAILETTSKLGRKYGSVYVAIASLSTHRIFEI